MSKKKYISPVTTLAGLDAGQPLMVTMTLYVASPFVELTTVTSGPTGYTSSSGQW